MLLSEYPEEYIKDWAYSNPTKETLQEEFSNYPNALNYALKIATEIEHRGNDWELHHNKNGYSIVEWINSYQVKEHRLR